ncbi:sialin-like isoform X4 [Mercenaria mercenaria]|uniref:sialin-like isoform X4 n=1 Tax=Mercenaria mercenaria TaxID=6596 RepID=UPI00234E6DF0|nr:sialin-like isoform X4 [Mercenaria mercenaria]
MADEAKETDKLDANVEPVPKVKYKDPHTFLCSTRWRMAAYIFVGFILLYMHRVNLSLAVVCMVDTTHTDTTMLHSNNSGIKTYIITYGFNGSDERNLTPVANVSIDEEVTHTIEKEVETKCGSIVSEENKGSVVPAGISMINAWSTPNERALMIAFCSSGCITALFTCLWIFEGHSLPSHHPRISEKELEYIETSRSHTTNTKRPKTPWKHLLISKPQWATFIAHFCFNWSFFTILINVPLFLKEVLKFEVKSNGLYSAVPFVFIVISSLVSGKLSAIIIKRQNIGHLATRRLFSTVCQLGMATCLVCAGYVSCEVRHIAVILLCLACTFAGFAYGGFLSNHPEYAGQFAGTAFGITNAGGVVSSIVASIMAGLLTPNGLQEEWQRVFYMAAGVNVVGTLAFVMCSDVYLQPWARNPEVITIEVDTAKELQDIKPLNKENDVNVSETIAELQEIGLLNKETSDKT